MGCEAGASVMPPFAMSPSGGGQVDQVGQVSDFASRLSPHVRVSPRRLELVGLTYGAHSYPTD